jgi:hypothetical protein
MKLSRNKKNQNLFLLKLDAKIKLRHFCTGVGGGAQLQLVALKYAIGEKRCVSLSPK